MPKTGRPSLGENRLGASPSRTVRLPKEMDDALTARAHAEHTTPSALIRQAVRDLLVGT
jgi:predicted transcriptional regulator